MLVFGEASRRETSHAKLDAIRTDLRAAEQETVGIVRHGRIAGALIASGELAQGVIDAEFAARGNVDARSPVADAALSLTVRLADLLSRSWSGRLAPGATLLAALPWDDLPPLPDEVDVRTPEGFAFYAVYPEAYLASARHLPTGRPVRVLGLRSIGTTLAATVAAASNAPLPITVRPIGPPFDRQLSLAPALMDEITAARDAHFAVVDEGPGLSGSSFATAIRTLESLEVGADRIHVFPSHRNEPGSEATAPNLAAWRRVRRHVTTFDDLALDARAPERRLATWFADLLGEPIAELEDLSGGSWRRLIAGPERDHPPVQPWLERRKFLLRTAAGPWLLKFAGLGAIGLRKLDRARALFEAGFSPQPAGWRHGFLAERWLGARPLTPTRLTRRDRSALCIRIGSYLGFRRRAFGGPNAGGASLDALLAMARHNCRSALGDAAAGRLDQLRPLAAHLARHVRPVETDNRMHIWEWLDGPNGLLKADALDHHCAHDLVGCQDIAWDVAGAIVEFDLSESETDTLCTVLERASGRPVVADLIRFLLPCYSAFQLGSWTMAAANASEADRAATGALLSLYRSRLSDGLL